MAAQLTNVFFTAPSQKAELASFVARVGLQFKDATLLQEALTHPSYSRDFHHGRLAVLGLSVVKSALAQHVYARFPNLPATEYK